MLLYVHRNNRLIRDGKPRTATSTFTQLLSSEAIEFVHCCFTSTEIIRTVRDGEPRTATSTFIQVLSSEAIEFVQCSFTSTEAIRTVRDGEPPRLSHSSELWPNYGCDVTFTCREMLGRLHQRLGVPFSVTERWARRV